MKNVLIYESILDIVDNLSDEQAGILFKGFSTWRKGIDPIFKDPLITGLWMGILPNLTKLEDNYKRKVEINRQNGKRNLKKDNPLASNETEVNQNEANESELKRIEANGTQKTQTGLKEKEKDKEKDKENVVVVATPIKNSNQISFELQILFDKFGVKKSKQSLPLNLWNELSDEERVFAFENYDEYLGWAVQLNKPYSLEWYLSEKKWQRDWIIPTNTQHQPKDHIEWYNGHQLINGRDKFGYTKEDLNSIKIKL